MNAQSLGRRNAVVDDAVGGLEEMERSLSLSAFFFFAYFQAE
ncbi:MAG: hypothetical protein ACYYK0_03560 [Candidatus Eutrophobiaceae bacterium]